jgi:YVTN family beta-propeller protein
MRRPVVIIVFALLMLVGPGRSPAAGHAQPPAPCASARPGPPRLGCALPTRPSAASAPQASGPHLATVGPIPVGAGPSAVAVDAATNTVYVANIFDNSVSVIDGATNGVSATIPVGVNPDAIAVDELTGRVYVANSGDNTVSVIGAAAGTVSATISVGTRPAAIAVDAATNRIYVANFMDSSIYVIDGATNAIRATFFVGANPDGVAVDEATNTIYVANRAGNSVSVVNGGDDTISATIGVGSRPDGVAVDAATDSIYVTNYSDGTVSVINGASGLVNATVTVGGNPSGIAVDDVTNSVYVTNGGSGSVSLIAGGTNTIGATLPVGRSPAGAAVDSGTQTVYVANDGSNSVTVINGANPRPLSIGVGFYPWNVAVNAATNTIYVADDNSTITSGLVSVIDGATDRVIGSPIAVGADPTAIAVDAATNTIYVLDYGNPSASPAVRSSVWVIHGADNSVGTPITVGYAAYALAVNEATNRVYVANYNDGTVSVIDGATGTVIGNPIAVRPGPRAIAVNEATDTIYVANDDGTVSVINGATNQQPSATPITVGVSAVALAVNPATNLVYVADFDNSGGASISRVTVIDGATNTIAGSPIGAGDTVAVAVNVTTNTIYITDDTDGTISAIDGATNGVIATIPVDFSPRGVAVNPTTDTVYVGDYVDTVSVIKGVAPPGAPTVLAASARDGAATVQWQAPSSNGGAPITSYAISASPATIPPIYVSGGASIALVPDLTNGTPYSFSVTAINALGPGQPSAASASVTPAAPPPLPDAAASTVTESPPSVPAGSSTGATVTVTLKDDAGNPVSGKTVSLSQPSGKQSVISAPSVSSNASGIVSFTVKDATAETVTYAATDTTDGVSLSQTASVSFTLPCTGCAIALQPSGGRASPGGSVTASVQVPASGVPSQGLAAWTIDVSYDPTLLQPTACTSQNSTCTTTFAPGVVRVTGQSSSGLVGGETLAQITFAASGPTATSSQVTATALRFSDSAGVPYAAAPGSLLVVVGRQGDVNLDGQVSATDALCVLRLVASLPVTNACPQTPATAVMADVNQDGHVTATDALCVLRQVAQLPATNACPVFGANGQPEVSNRADSAAPAFAVGPDASSVLRPQSSVVGGGRPAAQTPAHLGLQPSEVSAAAGKQTTVAVKVEVDGSRLTAHDSLALGAWTIDLHYDAAMLRVASCTATVGSLCNTDYAAGVIRIVGVSVSGLSGSQTLASVTFEARRNGTAASAVTVASASLSNPEGQPLVLVR